MGDPVERDGDARRQAELLERLRPRTFRRRVETLASLDEHFTANWLSHLGRTLGRPHLDLRTRLLTLVGQYTVLREHEVLAETIEAAINESVDPREPLEVILQCYVYTGEQRVSQAAAVFLDVVRERGLLDEVQKRQLPRDATRTGRSLEQERETWAEADRADPRLEPMLERYGWWGMSTGLRLRPGHQLNLATTLDALDPDFMAIWVDSVHEGLYSRGVLDERTRMLCVVANCFALRESHQGVRHMRVALRSGASPRELLELVIQSCAILGHPNIMPLAFDDVILLLDELGRLEEVVPESRIEEVRTISEARAARRHGSQDLGSGPGH